MLIFVVDFFPRHFPVRTYLGNKYDTCMSICALRSLDIYSFRPEKPREMHRYQVLLINNISKRKWEKKSLPKIGESNLIPYHVYCFIDVHFIRSRCKCSCPSTARLCRKT